MSIRKFNPSGTLTVGGWCAFAILLAARCKCRVSCTRGHKGKWEPEKAPEMGTVQLTWTGIESSRLRTIQTCRRQPVGLGLALGHA